MSEKARELLENGKIEAETFKLKAEADAIEAKRFPRLGFWIGLVPGTITIVSLVAGLFIQYTTFTKELTIQAEQANAEKKELILEIQMAQLDKYKADKAKEEAISEKKNAEKERDAAEKAKLDAIKELNELEGRKDSLKTTISQLHKIQNSIVSRQLTIYATACRIGGEIAAAETLQEALDYKKQFSDPKLSLVKTPEIAASISSLETAIDDWKKTKKRPNLFTPSLNLSFACKKAWTRDFGAIEGVEKILSPLRYQLYRKALSAASKTAGAETRKSAQEFALQFWKLYRGRMVLVETTRVEEAMVKFGEVLKDWTEGEPNKLLRDRLITEANNLKKIAEAEISESDQ